MFKKWCDIYWVLKKMVHSLKDSRIYYHQQFLHWKPGLNLFVQFKVKCIEFKQNLDVNQKFDNNEDNLTKLWRDLLRAKYMISLKKLETHSNQVNDTILNVNHIPKNGVHKSACLTTNDDNFPQFSRYCYTWLKAR